MNTDRTLVMLRCALGSDVDFDCLIGNVSYLAAVTNADGVVARLDS